jgi:hypothetical protein
VFVCRSVTTHDLMKRTASAAELLIRATSAASFSIVETRAPDTPQEEEEEDSFQAGVDMRYAVLRNHAAAGRLVGPWESVRDQTFAQLAGPLVAPAKSLPTCCSSLSLRLLDGQSRAPSESPPQALSSNLALDVHAVAGRQCSDTVRSEGSDSSRPRRQDSLPAGWGC